MNDDFLSSLSGPPEELHPDLQHYLEEAGVFGPCIKHPLVFSIVHHPCLNAHVNKMLAGKKRAVAAAIENRDWEQFMWLHERPYRLDALLEVTRHLDPEQDGKEFWQLAGHVWIDSENIHQNFAAWYDIFDNVLGFSDKPYFMSEDDRETMALPANKGGMNQQITVYRGFSEDGAEDGFSWTLHEDVAVWFAKRFQRPESVARVAKGTLAKRDVIALMTGRGEMEVVAFPHDVMGVEIKEV